MFSSGFGDVEPPFSPVISFDDERILEGDLSVLDTVPSVASHLRTDMDTMEIERAMRLGAITEQLARGDLSEDEAQTERNTVEQTYLMRFRSNLRSTTQYFKDQSAVEPEEVEEDEEA